MALLGRWTGGDKSQGNLPESWTAPSNLFDTLSRNDSSTYSLNSATSELTLPSTDLADGYLIIAAFEYEDDSNGRFNPQGRFIQSSGTGNFVSAYTGGYNRDNSEDRSYVRTWAVLDSPSASSTLQFQWKADSDDSTGGTVRSVIEIIPLYYSNIGIYNSTTAAAYGGTTPNHVTGFSSIVQSDTAAIEISSDTITLKGDNKRYLALGGQFFEGRGGRTQRWHGFRIDGTKDDATKAYSYYRNTSNDESGDMFTTIIDRTTTDITIDQFCYRGDGVGNLQGGADADGSVPSVGNHAIVILELNDTAEVFKSRQTANSSNLATSPTVLDVNLTTDFNDTDSFTDVADDSINIVKAGDYLFGANVSGASNNVANTGRYTGYAEYTVNGTIDPDSVSGDYLRNNQGSIDTFGWSANLLSYQALSANDDVGVTVTELAGSEGSGAPVSPNGWTGFWGINLDTLQASGGTNVSASTGLQSLSKTIKSVSVSVGTSIGIAAASTAIAFNPLSALGTVNESTQLNKTGYGITEHAVSVSTNSTASLNRTQNTLGLNSVSVSTSGATIVPVNEISYTEALKNHSAQGIANIEVQKQGFAEEINSPTVNYGTGQLLNKQTIDLVLKSVSVSSGGSVNVGLGVQQSNLSLKSIEPNTGTTTTLSRQDFGITVDPTSQNTGATNQIEKSRYTLNQNQASTLITGGTTISLGKIGLSLDQKQPITQTGNTTQVSWPSLNISINQPSPLTGNGTTTPLGTTPFLKTLGTSNVTTQQNTSITIGLHNISLTQNQSYAETVETVTESLIIISRTTQSVAIKGEIIQSAELASNIEQTIEIKSDIQTQKAMDTEIKTGLWGRFS